MKPAYKPVLCVVSSHPIKGASGEWIHEAPGKNRWGKARPEQTVMNDTHERAVPGDSNLYHFYCFV